MNIDNEVILIQPSFKAYAEYIAVGAVLLYYGGLGLLVFLAVWYHKASRSYEISGGEITVRRGLFRKSSEIFEIGRMTNIIVRQGSLQKMLDVGHLRIFFSNETTLDLQGIDHPQAAKALLAMGLKKLRGEKEKPASASEVNENLP